MARRKSRRPTGRPLRLMEPDVHKTLVDATKAGAPMETAAEYAGVSVRAFKDWMHRGRDELERRAEGHDPDPKEQVFVDLYNDVIRARSTAQVGAVISVRKAMTGGAITEETTRRYRDPETGQMVEETTVKRTAPDWRAGAWYLERRLPAEFGKAAQQVEVSGPGGAPIQMTALTAQELAERVRSNITMIAAAATPEEAQHAVEAEIVEDDRPGQ